MAGQSREVPEKDQQKVIVKAFVELNPVATEIEQAQTIEGHLVH